MPQDILSLLVRAINERRSVAIRYRDQQQIRVIEPHVIYADENGELVADCYQTRGYSSGGRPTPFWRPFRLKKITAASLLTESFVPRINEGFVPTKPKYRNGQKALVKAAPLPDGTRSASTPFVYPHEMAPNEIMGPFLPKNPYRR